MKKKASHFLRRTISTFFTDHPKNMEKTQQHQQRYSYNPSLRWNPELESYFSHAYTPTHFSLISKALTRPSCYSCIRVNTLKSTPDSVVEKLRGILKGASISKCEVEGLEYLLFVKGSGPHSVDYTCLDHDGNVNVDPPPIKELLVSRKYAEAVLRGAEVNWLFENL